MDEKIQALPKRRRTRAECEQLVADFGASGLNRTEFCRQHGLSLTTLARYRKRRQAQLNVPAAAGWLAVELCNAQRVAALEDNRLLITSNPKKLGILRVSGLKRSGYD